MRALLLATCSLLATAAVAQHATLRIPESAEPIKISLASNTQNSSEFTSITIRADGHTVTFHPRNPIACAPAAGEDRKRDISWFGIQGMKLDGSLCFYIGQFGAGAAEHTLLAFISEGGASDAAPVFVIGFGTEGTPYKVLERDELDLTALKSIDTNSAIIIGSPTLSEMVYGNAHDEPKPYATTYDPFAVYLVRSGQPAAFSLTETRRYNLENYVWRGSKMSEDWAVVYNLPGHPKRFLVPTNEVDTLFRSSTQKHQ